MPTRQLGKVPLHWRSINAQRARMPHSFPVRCSDQPVFSWGWCTVAVMRETCLRRLKEAAAHHCLHPPIGVPLQGRPGGRVQGQSRLKSCRRIWLSSYVWGPTCCRRAKRYVPGVPLWGSASQLSLGSASMQSLMLRDGSLYW